MNPRHCTSQAIHPLSNIIVNLVRISIKSPLALLLHPAGSSTVRVLELYSEETQQPLGQLFEILMCYLSTCPDANCSRFSAWAEVDHRLALDGRKTTRALSTLSRNKFIERTLLDASCFKAIPRRRALNVRSLRCAVSQKN